jgi:hypothetical protein
METTVQLANGGVQVPTVRAANQLTAAQVCDLPMGELLARTGAAIGLSLDFSDPVYDGVVTTPMFGYLVSRKAGATLHIRSDATEDAHDIYVRYLLTQYLGLSTHLFPDVLQHTVFVGPNLDEAQA